MMYKYKILKKTVRQKMILKKISEDSEGCVSLMIDYNHQKEYCNDVVKVNRFFLCVLNEGRLRCVAI